MLYNNKISKIKEIETTDQSYPFSSAKKYGYLEEARYDEKEYYMYGTANVYKTGEDGSIEVWTGDTPYVNRFIVRYPREKEKFSGNVVIEIINPTSFMEIERMWILAYKEFLRKGDIYVGITSKPNTIDSLRKFDQERYSEMNWSNPNKQQPFPFSREDIDACGLFIPDDQKIEYETGLFWDMLTDLTELLRSDDEKNPIRSYHPQTVVLTGWSQSANYLVRYINDFAYRDENRQSLYDGFLVAAPPRHLATPVNQYETVLCAKKECVKLKQVKVPCIVFQTESENALFGTKDIVRPDGNEQEFMCVHYDIAGASHDTAETMIAYYKEDEDMKRIGFLPSYSGKNKEPNRYPIQILAAAMFRNLFYWIHTGVAPQPCERIQVDSKGENIKDALGNSIGGLRTCLLDYPTGSFYLYSDVNVGENGMFPELNKDFVFGHEEAFPKEMLKRMYGSLEHYRSLVEQHTWKQVMKGYVIREDAASLVDEALRRAKERGLE